MRTIVRDITSRKELEIQLEEMSVRDPLTGCFNRRYLEKRRGELEQTGAHWACLLFDLTGFKEINDTYGHDEGDRVLRAFAHFLLRLHRSEDILVRLGGGGETATGAGVARYRGGGEGDERMAIVAALAETHGVLARAAELLGVGRTTLWRKLRAYGLEATVGEGGGQPEGPGAGTGTLADPQRRARGGRARRSTRHLHRGRAGRIGVVSDARAVGDRGQGRPRLLARRDPRSGATSTMSGPVAHEDFVDVVACLNAEGCAYVIVGAHALAAHGSPRATGDLDVFVRPDADNAERVFRALTRFGAPLGAHGISSEDFRTEGTVYQMGLPPRRIDILTQISGVSFDEAVEHRVAGRLGTEEVRYLGLDAMIRNKRAAARPKDLGDLAVLQEIKARRDAAR